MKSITLVRHGQSTFNAGAINCTYNADIKLTSVGEAQAEHVAVSWSRKPDLIISSPYARALDTARPTRDRFPETPFEVWPVQEFTYLDPESIQGMTGLELQALSRRYWERNDPAARNGEAESLGDLFRRAHAFLDRAHTTAFRDAHVFTHGVFIRAVLAALRGEDPLNRKDDGYMQKFRRPHHQVWNAEMIRVIFKENGGHSVLEFGMEHLPPDLVTT